MMQDLADNRHLTKIMERLLCVKLQQPMEGTSLYFVYSLFFFFQKSSFVHIQTPSSTESLCTAIVFVFLPKIIVYIQVTQGCRTILSWPFIKSDFTITCYFHPQYSLRQLLKNLFSISFMFFFNILSFAVMHHSLFRGTFTLRGQTASVAWLQDLPFCFRASFWNLSRLICLIKRGISDFTGS